MLGLLWEELDQTFKEEKLPLFSLISVERVIRAFEAQFRKYLENLSGMSPNLEDRNLPNEESRLLKFV